MTYKTIVTIVRSSGRDRAHLEAAIDMTRQADGHLHVLALGTDRVQPGGYYIGGDAIAIQTSMSEAVKEAKEAEAAARGILKQTDISWEVTGAVTQIGGIASMVARCAGLADLVVLPKPYGEGRSSEDVAVTEAALFSTRTPILVVPVGVTEVPPPNRIVIAWNQSSEALSAIRAAMPLLIDADNVDITIVDPPEHDPDRSDPGGQLAEMLARHGVRADISVLAKTLPRISDVLCRHVRDTDADMLVMGAYGHSRFREAILGGATRNMLAEATIPVLMAH